MKNTGNIPFEKLYKVDEIDGKTVISADIETETGTHVSNFLLDFDKGQIQELGLFDNMNHPIEICGTYGDNVYVIYQYVMKPIQVEMNGVVDFIELPVGQCGYLTKDDFFSDKANYTPCDSI